MLRQLRELEALLTQEGAVEKRADFQPSLARPVAGESEIRQMKSMMASIESKSLEADPEMQQLEQLIDKLLVLRNPQTGLHQGSILVESIPAAMKDSEEGLLDPVSPAEINGFFGLMEKEEPVITERKVFRKTVAASVAKTQEIFPGEAIEIRLDQDLMLESGMITAGTVLFGQTAISGSRLQLTVSGILQNNSLIPVSLKAYGLDGIPGIELGEVKGSAQWLKETGSAAQGINISAYGMDWQSQLASSGVEATRSLLRSKSKLKKLEIKSGHPFLLIDSSTSNSKQL